MSGTRSSSEYFKMILEALEDQGTKSLADQSRKTRLVICVSGPQRNLYQRVYVRKSRCSRTQVYVEPYKPTFEY